MGNEWFGLGLSLEVKDRATDVLLKASTVFDNVENQAESLAKGLTNSFNEVESQMNNLRATLMAGLSLQNIGNEFMNFGKKMVEPLVDMGKQVINTGSKFENWRKTLKALYKDEEVARKKLNWGMDLAASTPFEIENVTQAIIGFKAVGVEADKTFKDVNGNARTFLEYIGDLAALRPDVGMEGVFMGVRNLLGGDGGRSLRSRLDIDAQQILGRKWAKSTEGKIKDLVEFSQKIAGGLMKELEGTWGHMISNIQDQTTRFFLSIADTGAFDTAKKTLAYIYKAIDQIDSGRIKALGVNLSQAFGMIWKPIDFAVKKIVDFLAWVERLAEQDSKLGKIVAGFLAIAGSVTIVSGVILKFAGGMLQTIATIGLFMIALKQTGMTLATIKASIATTSLALLKFGAVLGLAYALWKSDFGGMRTTLQNFMGHVYTAFKESARIANLGVNDMITALSYLDMNSFGGILTYRLVQIRVLFMALVDAWNDNTLSDENFRKVQELGLLPLLETILDVKMRAEEFFKGFKEGFKDLSEKVKSAVTAIKETIKSVLRPMQTLHGQTADTVDVLETPIDMKTWRQIGKAVGFFGTLIFLGLKLAPVIKFIFNILSGGVRIIGKIFGGVKSLIGLIIAHPIVALIIGIVVALVYCYFKFEEFRKVVDKVFKAIGLIIEGLVGEVIFLVSGAAAIIFIIFSAVYLTIAGILGGIKLAFEVAFAGIIDIVAIAIGAIITVILTIIAVVKSVFVIIEAIVRTVLAVIKAIFTGDFTQLGEDLKKIWGDAGEKLTGIWSDTVDKIKKIWGTITGFINGVWDEIKVSANSFFEWIGNKFAWVGKSIGAIKGAFEFGGGLADKAASGLKNLVGLDTGGYVKETGLAVLHPNEVVVNDELTQRLRTYLDNDKGQQNPVFVMKQPNGPDAYHEALNKPLGSVNNVRNSSTTEENSVIFNEGSISISLQNGGEAEAEKLVQIILKKIKREKELRDVLNYKKPVRN